MQIIRSKTSKGMDVFKVLMPTSESVTVLAMIRAGSRDEFDGKWGVAHFLEHFVFKGTKEFPKVNDVTKAIDGIGGKMNAFTGNDYTGFWVKVAKEKIATGLKVVGQLICEPLLPNEHLENEKGTIIEELKMYEDDHRSKAFEKMDELTFEGSDLGRPVIGYKETIYAVKKEDLDNFRQRWYFPSNVVLIVAGGVDSAKDLDQLIEDNFGSLSGERNDKNLVGYNKVFTQESPRVVVTERKIEQVNLAFGVRTFKNNDERVYPLWVMNQILGANMSSRLWDEVREKRGLAYFVRSAFGTHTDTGMFMVGAGVRADKYKEAVDVIVNEIMKLTTSEVSDEELKMGIDGAIGNFKLDLEDSQEVASIIGGEWCLNDGNVRSLESMVEKVSLVDKKTIKELAVELFKKREFNLSLVGPVNEKGLLEILQG